MTNTSMTQAAPTDVKETEKHPEWKDECYIHEGGGSGSKSEFERVGVGVGVGGEKWMRNNDGWDAV